MRLQAHCRSTRPLPLWGWTGCFPRGDSLQGLHPQHPEKHPMDTSIAPLASIGIDIGKEVFHVVGLSTDGRIAFFRKIKRLALVETQKAAPEYRWHGGV